MEGFYENSLKNFHSSLVFSLLRHNTSQDYLTKLVQNCICGEKKSRQTSFSHQQKELFTIFTETVSFHRYAQLYCLLIVYRSHLNKKYKCTTSV